MLIALDAYHTALIVSAGQSFALAISMAKNMDRRFALVLRQWDKLRKWKNMAS